MKSVIAWKNVIVLCWCDYRVGVIAGNKHKHRLGVIAGKGLNCPPHITHKHAHTHTVQRQAYLLTHHPHADTLEHRNIE